MKMLKSNFIEALVEAVLSRSSWEKNVFGEDFESATVRGWKDVLKALKDGESIEIGRDK